MSRSDAQNAKASPGKKILGLVAIVLVAILSDYFYNHYGNRSAVVEATSGSLRLVLTRELNGKFFENAIVCRKQQNGRLVATGAPYGCSRRTHELTPPRNQTEEVGREDYNLTLPAGTEIVLTARPDLVTLRVITVPENYAEAEAGQLLGGGIILDADAIRAFGSLVMTGHALIGASQSETDRQTITEGSYQFSGPTPATFLDKQWRVVRSAALLSGSTVYFANPGADVSDPFSEKSPETRLTVSVPDPVSSLLRITGISDEGPITLKIVYFSAQSQPVRPSITNVLLADPILTFLATLVLGVIGIYEFVRGRN